MKEWMTAAEIAACALPELPTTKRGVSLRAEAEQWDQNPAYARKRDGKGGGYEYHFRLLPTLAQVTYMQRHMTISAANNEAAQPDHVPAAPSLTGRATEERDARLAIVAAFERFAKGLPRLRQASHLQLFTDKYDTGALAIEAWVKDLIPKVGKRTLLKWLSDKRAGNIDALAFDRGQSRQGTGVFDLAENGRLQAFVLALVIEQPHFSAKHIRTLCIDEFGLDEMVDCCGKRVPMPPIRTFQWEIKKLKEDNEVLITKITNPDKYRSTMRASGTGMMRHIREAGQLWMIDASPVDALCVDGRHSIYIAIDLATRRIVVIVSRTPRASAVGLMIRKAAMAWGVPNQIKTDNGSDFVAQETKRLFTALDIEPILSAKYSPAEKAHVERVIGTFQRTVGPLLPGFIGHDVTDRKAIEDRKAFAARLGTTDAEAFGVQLTSAELQQKIDDWVQFDYEHDHHQGIGKTPFAAGAASTVRPRMVHERALDALLMPVAGKNGLRTVTAQGIRINGYFYGVSAVPPREQVFVRMDPNDMGTIYVYRPDATEYLGQGHCPELSGHSPAEFWRAVREAHADILREGGKWMEAERRRLAKGPTFIDRYLRVKKAQNGTVVALPKRTEEHTTPAIAAALAAQARQAPTQQSDAVLVMHAKLQAAAAAMAAPNVKPLPIRQTPEARFARACAIERAVEAGQQADADDLIWLGGYREGPEYRGLKLLALRQEQPGA